MRLVYLASAEADLRWFKLYYTQTFPEGRKKADAQFLHTQRLLRENPMMGHAVEKYLGRASIMCHTLRFHLCIGCGKTGLRCCGC